MELKEEFKKGASIFTEKYGVVNIVNDSKMFKAYKKMGLDVFKIIEKKEKKKDN